MNSPKRLSLLLTLLLLHSTANAETVDSESLLQIMLNKTSNVDDKIGLLLTRLDHGLPKEAIFDSKMENQICSVNSRVIELENEIDGIKSSLKTTGSGVKLPDDASIISTLQFQLESLSKSFAEETLKTKELEQRMQQIDATFGIETESEIELENFCKIESFHIRELQRMSFLHHLQQINFNIFLRKPSNSSKIYTADTYDAEFGIDGNFQSRYASASDRNPWFLVNLEGPYLIWEVKIILHIPSRANALKIYVTNDVTFDAYGKPDLTSVPLFASHLGKPKSLEMSFTHPGGMCGRYVIVTREVEAEILEFYELQGVGYGLERH